MSETNAPDAPPAGETEPAYLKAAREAEEAVADAVRNTASPSRNSRPEN